VLNIQEAYQTEIDSLTKRAKTAESAFLSVYKVIAEAPDPYPLLEAALVRVLDETQTLRSSRLQDQAVKASEADDLEAQVRRLREENAELRKKVNEVSSLESAKAKAEGKLEQMEAKVRSSTVRPKPVLTCHTDGGADQRASRVEEERAQCHV
jgi:homeobox protein cut-like